MRGEGMRIAIIAFSACGTALSERLMTLSYELSRLYTPDFSTEYRGGEGMRGERMGARE